MLIINNSAELAGLQLLLVVHPFSYYLLTSWFISILLMLLQPTGVLVERNIDDQHIFSPDRVGHQTTRALSMAVLSPKGQYIIKLDTKSYRGGNLEPSSPKNEKYVVPATSRECTASLRHLEATSGNAGNDADIQSFSM